MFPDPAFRKSTAAGSRPPTEPLLAEGDEPLLAEGDGEASATSGEANDGAEVSDGQWGVDDGRTDSDLTVRRIDPAAGTESNDSEPSSADSALGELVMGSELVIGSVVEPSQVSRIDRATPAKPSPADSGKPRRPRPDPVAQSLMLLVTMAVMLAAARFAVPGIVEEIRYAWLRGELRAEYETGVDGLQNVSLDALSDAYEMVTAAVGPSVVHIEVQRRPSIEAQAEIARLLPDSKRSDQGSGVIVDASGYLLTNRHVVSEGEDITVTLSDGRARSAVIVGTDAFNRPGGLENRGRSIDPDCLG